MTIKYKAHIHGLHTRVLLFRTKDRRDTTYASNKYDFKEK